MSHVHDLLKRLQQAGVILSLEGQQLRVRAPEGVLSQEMLAEIKAGKESIIAFIRQHRHGKTWLDDIEPAEKREYYILSPVQKRLFFIQQLDKESYAYNMTGVLEVAGKCDKERLEQVFRGLVSRHESLRTVFFLVSAEPVQRIYEKIDFDLEVFEEIQGFVRPFDLGRAPLLRVGWVQLAEERHILVIDMHHIISDGYSIGIVTREFMTLFQGNSPAPLTIQYKDYAVWQGQEGVRGLIKQMETSWLERFSGAIPVLTLPCDFPRPAFQDFSGDSVTFDLEKEAVRALQALANRQEATLYMVLLAAFYVCLSRSSGQEDVVVGAPVAGREHDCLQAIVGMFVNTLAMRNAPHLGKSFSAFLNEVKESTVLGFQDQLYPLEELVDRVVKSRDSSRNPLFDVMFVLQNMDTPVLEIPGLKLIPRRMQTTTAKVDLTMVVGESPTGLSFFLEYSTSLFKEGTIRRLAGYYQRILGAVIGDPNRLIGEIDILDEKEKQRLLIEFNDSAVVYPGEMTITELVAGQVQRTPDRIALSGETVGVNGHLSRRYSLSYSELDRRAGWLAGKLIEQGVLPNTIVGIKVERSIEMIIGILGILQAGGAYLPIDPAYPQERIDFMLADCRAEIVIGSQAVGANCCSPIQNIGAECKGERQFAPTDLAYVIYTSGTSGRPKGNLISHRNVIRVVKDTNYLDIFPHDRLLQLSNYAFDGSVFDIYGALLNGAALIIPGPAESGAVAALSALIQREAISLFFVTTALFNVLVDLALPSLASVRKILFGGERVSVEHTRKALAFLGNDRLMHVYGPTESTVYATYYDIDDLPDNAYTVPIGRPITNTGIYVLDRLENLVPIGVTGEIYIGGQGLSRGYLNNPELTAERFVGADIPMGAGLTQDVGANCNSPLRDNGVMRLYKTGDLGRWLDDGNIEFLGRIDQQVKIRGFRIELGEIEAQLLKHPAIREALVVCRDQGAAEKFLCAYFVPHDLDQGREMKTREWREFLSRNLPDYMVPTYFVGLGRFPLNASGKVDVRALPEPGMKGPITDYTAARDEIEQKLVEIWAEVLGDKQGKIGIDDHFFERGGHSLKAMKMAALLHRELEVEIPVRKVFEFPTIREMAQFVRGAGKKTFAALKPAEKREYYPVSVSQQRFYMIQQVNPQSTAFNIFSAWQVEGRLDRERFSRAVQDIIGRHESLRTAFQIISGEVVQRVHEKVGFELEVSEIEGPKGQKGPKGQELVEQIIKGFVRPFDLGTAPLLRVGLVSNGSDSRILLFDIHHIVADGSSMKIFIDDLVSFYNENPPSALSIQYRDFSLWQQRLQESEEMQVHRRYWLDQLQGPLPALNLATDFPRARTRSYDGDDIHFSLGKEPTASIRQFLLATGTTLYMLLLAVLNVLLSRTTGQEDIVIGSPIAGRDHADLENLIGLLIGSLAIRNYPRKHKIFKDFLAEVKENTLRAYEHQSYPFEEILKEVAYEDIPGRNPITDVSLMVQNMALGRLEGGPVILGDGDLRLTPFQAQFRHQTKLDLTLSAVEREEDIAISIEYVSDLFKRETITRLARHFRTILADAVLHPQASLQELEMFDTAEREEIAGSSARWFPLSHAQQRIYYSEKRFPGTAVSTLGFLVRYREELDLEVLNEVINQVISGHEGLRLRLVEVDAGQEAWQYVSPFERRTVDLLDFSGPEGESRLAEWIDRIDAGPFPLTDSELFYFARLKLPQGDSGYFLKAHHIVADGWTLYMLFDQIEHRYRLRQRGERIDETAYPSYLDYLADERDYLNSDRAFIDREFFKQTLLPLPEEVSLSTQTRDIADIRGGRLKFALPADLLDPLYACLEQHQELSIYKLLFSVLAIIISRVNRCADFVIGSVNHGRSTGKQKQMAGMFVSTIPLRVQVDPKTGFLAFVERHGREIDRLVKQHQRYPFDLLALDIRQQTGRDLDYLLNVNLIGHGDSEEKVFQTEFYFAGFEQTELAIHIFHKPKVPLLELEWLFLAHLFTDDEIGQLHRVLLYLLRQGLGRPDQELSGLEMAPEADRAFILGVVNGTNLDYAQDKVLPDLLWEQAGQSRDRVAMTGRGKPGDVQVTYGELVRGAGVLAQELRARGVGRESIVAIMMEPSIDMIAGILGILKAGGAYLPIDPGFPQERIDYMLADSGAEIIIGQHGVGANCCSPIQDIGAECKGERQFAPTDLAYVIYTSGTSGRPKGVAVSQQNVIAYLAAFQAEFHLGPQDIIIQQASYTFDAFVEEMYPALLCGGRLVMAGVQTVRDPDLLAALMEKLCVTMITCSPLLLSELNRRLPAGRGRLFISGGDVLRPAHVDRLIGTGRVYNTYGPTETTVCATYYRCPAAGQGSTVPIGKPVANYKVIIMDGWQRLVPLWVTGEIWISGPGVARGYLNNPELTAERFVTSPLTPHLYKTGDLGRWLGDGNIEFLGRIDQQVKIRGFRIELGDIEAQLKAYPGVLEATVTVIGAGDERALCAYLVWGQAGAGPDSAQMREFLAGKVPAYMIPAYFVYLDHLPLNRSGKVDKKALPRPEITAGPAHVAPRDGLEERLAVIWAETLGLGDKSVIGIDDNFFLLGGHSLRATTVTARIHQELNIKVPLAEVFKTPTIRGLAAFISAAEPERFLAIRPVEKKEYYLLSPAQKRLYMVQQLAPGSLIFNMPNPMIVTGVLEKDRLEKAFQGLIDRHESFRTYFVMAGAEVVQRVSERIDFELEVYEEIQGFVRPFDLARAPLFRVGWIKRAEDDHILILDTHHLISDGTSQALMIRDILALYSGRDLPPLKLQYKDYAQWRNSEAVTRKIADQEKFWLDQFAGGVPDLDLPLDFPRPDVQGFAGQEIDCEISAAEVKALNEIAMQAGVSQFSLLMALVAILLAKLTGKEDIVVGTQVAGRPHADLAQIIGVMLNTLVLRNFPRRDLTFREFLAAVSAGTLAAFENQDYLFEDLAEKLLVKREANRNPVFDVMLVWQNMGGAEEEIPGLTVRPFLGNHKAQALIDLSIYGFPGKERFSFSFEYNTALFKEETIRRFTLYFQEILSVILSDPDITIGDIGISHHLAAAGANAILQEADGGFEF